MHALTAEVRNEINIARSFLEQAEPDRAISIATKLLREEATSSEVWKLFGESLLSLGAKEEACSAFLTATELNPDDIENKVMVGRMLRETGEIHRSLRWLRELVEDNDSCVEGMREMHDSLIAISSLPTPEIKIIASELLEYYQKALLSDPTRLDLYYSLSHLLIQLGRSFDAVELLRGVRAILEKEPAANYNFAMTLKSAGLLSESLQILKSIEPSDDGFGAQVRHATALALLQGQNYAEGWPLWESRWKDRHFTESNSNTIEEYIPRWTGMPVERLLVWAEQGVGDEVMFSSMLNELNERCNTLTVACDPRLIQTFQRSFFENINFISTKDKMDPRDFDAQVPMGSLGAFFRPDLESFAGKGKAFLQPNWDVVKKIRKNLEMYADHEIIGLSWFSNSTTHARLIRNIDLTALINKISVSGKVFVCLQYGDVEEDIAKAKMLTGIELINPSDIDQKNDLTNLVNLIAACDRVISIDNATIHFAGALGVPTTVLVPYSPDWRWPFGDKNSPWYDSLTIHHQSEPGYWPSIN